MATTEITLTQAYQEVTVGASGNLIIQASTSLRLHIDAAAQPADNAAGLQLSPNKDGTAFSSGGLTGKKVWVKQGSNFKDGKAVIATW